LEVEGVTPYYDAGGVTIYCGDCTRVAPSLVGVDAVISDPPYGMAWDSDCTRFSGGSAKSVAKRGGVIRPAVAGDDSPFNPAQWIAYKRVILWGFHHFADRLPSGSVLVWIKRLDGAFGSFLSDADLAWMKGGCGVYCRRDLSLNGETATRAHPTQKPVPLMEWCIQRSGVPLGGVVLDPFMGSGTTLVAAKNLGRRAIGIEIEERYCEIAAKRLSQEVLPLVDAPKTADEAKQAALFAEPE
jgi:site-specific DNA-methyltransferase (adenine-specific)